jgi:seryl-tRNA synthetase
MPLDINTIRAYKGGDPEKVRESQRRRFADVVLVDKVIAEDEEWRRLVALADDKRGEKNAKQKEITALKKAKKEVAPQMLKDLKALDAKVKEAEAATEPQLQKVLKMFNTIGNLVEDSVPFSNDEDKDNEVVNKWGTCKQDAKYSHHELLYMIGGYEPERGVRVAGHRAYFFTDYGVLLNQAVINYGIAFLRKKQYKILQPPYMMNKDLMGGVAQLSEFDEALYKVTGGDQEKYLIATSEQPICAYHKGEWLQESELPLRYAGVSTCFRKEAGSHGRDTWGIFRVHQFEKVEQFCLTTGDLEKSNEMHEEMREIAEEYIQSMGFPYHVVNIVSGELNNAAIKKYDIECWFPFQKKYRELVSCSNCTDYQSRAMEVRCGGKKMGSREKKYVHMLNSTLCACGRTICCLLENNQTDTGVVVPPVLRPFMGGVDFMPFIRTMDGKPFKAPVAPSNPEAAACAAQGDKIRQIKAAKASKDEIMAAVDELKKLKAKHLEVHGVEFAPTGTVQGSRKGTSSPKSQAAWVFHSRMFRFSSRTQEI